ncbi:CpsD/CapB family tyrosine-protein kinase [Cohnella hongkongensis]|uniref:non-specific protein-tyrosine kinase n=1 Tax=Cohnella hongkongensis TaxID=178337 RepID=A0ABV9F8B9_9BACL
MSGSQDRIRLLTSSGANLTIAESYRTLRTNLGFAAGGAEIGTLLVTSTVPSEGKSTTVSNLAVSYAETNKKVLLVDADLRRPSLHHLFAVPPRFGLSYLLTDQCKLEEAITDTFIPNLSIIPSGPSLSNPYDCLGSSRMDDILGQLKERYDIILIDSSPVLAVSDAQLLSKKCDGVLFVIRYGQVKRTLVQKAIAQLRHADAHLLGVVLNDKKRSRQDRAYSY